MSEPIVRLVQMKFCPDRVSDFLKLFDERSMKIRDFPGCRHLDLLGDVRDQNVMTTLSVWDSESALETYRRSDLFKQTWSLTREMFADRPIASSYVMLREVGSSD